MRPSPKISHPAVDHRPGQHHEPSRTRRGLLDKVRSNARTRERSGSGQCKDTGEDTRGTPDGQSAGHSADSGTDKPGTSSRTSPTADIAAKVARLKTRHRGMNAEDVAKRWLNVHSPHRAPSPRRTLNRRHGRQPARHASHLGCDTRRASERRNRAGPRAQRAAGHGWWPASSRVGAHTHPQSPSARHGVVGGLQSSRSFSMRAVVRQIPLSCSRESVTARWEPPPAILLSGALQPRAGQLHTTPQGAAHRKAAG